MNCLVVTPEIRKLTQELPGEIEQSVLSLVALWQEQNNKSMEEYPSSKELKAFMEQLRSSETKESFNTPQVTPTREQNLVDLEFDPRTRRDRVSLISRLFSNEIDRALNTEEFKSADRMGVIRTLTPAGIFERVLNTFKSYVNSPEDERIVAELDVINNTKGAYKYSEEQRYEAAKKKAAYKSTAYNKIINNFTPLAEEASVLFSFTEGIVIDSDFTSPSRTNLNEDPIETGSILDEQSENWSQEETIKDGWMVHFREVSSHESLSQMVRKAISTIPKLNYKGKYEKDDLGNVIYLEANYVHATLIDCLKDMVTSEDMIPLLQKLSNQKIWVKQIIKKLQEDEVLFSQFYHNFRKDFTLYWIQKKQVKPDGTPVTQLISVNKPEGISFLIDSWRYNYESGSLLDEDSVYNSNGTLNLDNAQKGLDISNFLINKFNNLDYNDKVVLLNNDEIWNNINKVLHMVGIDINPTTLRNALSVDKSTQEIEYADPVTSLLTQLNVIFRGISKDKVKTEGIDLINTFSSAYSTIAASIAEVTDNAIESSIRENDKTYYSHNTPSYLGKLIKLLKNTHNDIQKFNEFINTEYKQYEWFFKDGRWRNDWLNQLVSSSDARRNLNHKVVLHSGKIDYTNWDSLDYTLVLLNEYWGSPEDSRTSTKWAWYHVPILSDAPSAEFIKFRRYVDGVEYDNLGNRLSYQDIILDKLSDLLLQEYDRIMLVRARHSEIQKGNKNIKLITNYDMTSDNIGGAEFKFLPALNSIKYEDGSTFVEKLYQISTGDDISTLKGFIRDTLITIMDEGFKEAYKHWENIGLLNKNSKGKFIHLPFSGQSEESVNKAKEALREYYWNSKFATSQIIQLTTTDLAFYKDLEDFQKRFKEIHAPSLRLNTKATYNGEEVGRDWERTIYLKDDEIVSSVLSDIKEVLDIKVNKGEIQSSDRDAIIKQFQKVNVTDAQAYRSLSSYRAVMVMAGQWTEAMESAYNNFRNNTWNIADFNVIWQPIKPFVYTQINNQSGIEGHTGIKTPVQHKNSEFLLLAMYDLIAGPLGRATKLKAINEFMEENNIDVVQFESAVKVGKQGVINLNVANNPEQVNKVLKDSIMPNGVENPNVVHKVSYEDYGIQQPVPEHAIDTTQLVGTQIRKLITADIADDTVINVSGKNLTKKELLDLYNAVTVENVLQSYLETQQDFSDSEKLEKLLKEEFKSNQKYESDLLKAYSLISKNQFNIPLFEPTQSLRIQSLLSSIIKSRVTKQKIKGGTLVQVSPYGLDDDLSIVFEGEGENKRIKYFECYMPAYSREFYEPLMEEGNYTLNVDELPEDLRNLVGYRIPTEDKYSMIPLRIKGFLPPQNGSVIMLPSEITTLSGSDYDIDKLFIMLPEFKTIRYNYKQAMKDFKGSQETMQALALIFTGSNIIEDLANTPIEFQEWFAENKAKYLLNKPEFKKIKYDFSKSPKDNSLEARNNLLIDMMWGILTNPDTASKILNPGGFDYQKRAARIVDLLKSSSKEDIQKALEVSQEEIMNKLNTLTIDELDNLVAKFKKPMDPLSPITQVQLHRQNMTGAKLIGIYANHNANHALIQHTDLALDTELGAFYLNGKRLTSLHSTTNNEKEFISRNNAGFLAAAVDNVKDPVLAALNQNLFTADASMLLSRLGYTPIEIGILMNQPIVLDITQEYLRESRNGNSKEAIINNVVKRYEERAGITKELSYDNYKYSKFPLSTLANYILIAKDVYDNKLSNKAKVDFYENQAAIGLLFNRILKVAEDLSLVVLATRADTQNGGAGPSIADTIIKTQKVNDLLDSVQNNKKFSLIGADVIDNSISLEASEDSLREQLLKSKLPYINAFYTLGLKSTEKILSPYFPHYSESFNYVVESLRRMTRSGRLNSKTLNNIYNDLLTYILSSTEFFNSTKRKDFIDNFPTEFKRVVAENEDIGDLEFIKGFKVIKANRKNLKDTLELRNVGSINSILKDRYLRDWTSLLYSSNPEAQKLALNLVRYNYYRGGLGFSPSLFAHLVPSVVKESIPDYINTLRDLLTTTDDYTELIDQYIYNHLYDRQFVPEVTSESSFTFNEGDKLLNEVIVRIDETSSYEDKKVVKDRIITSDGIIYKFFKHIARKFNNEFVYYELIPGGIEELNTAVYRRITPLGVRNKYVEYEYGKQATEITSIFNERVESDASVDTDIGDYLIEEPADINNLENYSETVLNQVFEAMYNSPFDDYSTEENDITSISPNTEYRDANNDTICG